MDWFVIGPEMLGVLFAAALLAGFIDSIAGGGGLLTVPALLAVGFPAQALATNKLQSVGGSFSASLYFIRRRAVNLNDQKLTIFLTLIGSIAGAILVQHMRADLLRQMLPLLVIGIGLYFLLMPRLVRKIVNAASGPCRLGWWPAVASGFTTVSSAPAPGLSTRWPM